MSTDHTVARARSAAAAAGLPVRIVAQTDEQRLIPTRNRGLDEARGEVIARIDADTIVNAGWVHELTRIFESTTVAATSGPVGYYDLPLTAVNRWIDNFARRVLTVVSGRDLFLFGCNMALRRSAWESIRSSACRDTDDLFHEDIDLAIHLRQHGLSIGYAPRLGATVSARSTGRTSTEFADYTRRFERTLDAHDMIRRPIRVAGALLRLAYPALHRAHRYEKRRALRT
jgi:glycosyltransferase involved in cell wall biosynthesis